MSNLKSRRRIRRGASMDTLKDRIADEKGIFDFARTLKDLFGKVDQKTLEAAFKTQDLGRVCKALGVTPAEFEGILAKGSAEAHEIARKYPQHIHEAMTPKAHAKR